MADVPAAGPYGYRTRPSAPAAPHRKLALTVLLASALVLFVAGSVCSGLFFLSRATELLAATRAPSFAAGGERASDGELTPAIDLSSAAAADRDLTPGADAAPAADRLPPSQARVPAQPAAEPRFALLLLGYGGGGHDGGLLTDSMTLVIANPGQKTMALLSIPRDSWIPQIFDGRTAEYNKLNTAYAFAHDTGYHRDRLPRYTGSRGPGTFVTDTVARILGVPISNYVALDFAGFRQMIDAVGGIDVDVPVGFSAAYPANDDPSIDPSWIVVRFAVGRQHMSGERAIQYARARETIDTISEGTDFARSRRQRLIMESFKARVFEPGGLLRLPQLLAIATRHVDTDYALPAVGQLTQLALQWQDVRFFQTALSNENYLQEATGTNGGYLLVPAASDHSWAQVRGFVRRLWDDPALGVALANTRIVVENNTGRPEVATRLRLALERLGYRLGPSETGPVRAQSRLIDRTGGTAGPVADQLAADLKGRLPQFAELPAPGKHELRLQIGTDDAGLANLVIPPDEAAPFSTVGVEKFGIWSPPPPPPEPTETPGHELTGTISITGTAAPNAADPTPSAPTAPR